MLTTHDIIRVLNAIPLPVDGVVARWDVEVGTDHSGEPAVWVYVIAHDDKIEELLETRRDGWKQLRRDICAAVEKLHGPDMNTYVRVRALSEVDAKQVVNG